MRKRRKKKDIMSLRDKTSRKGNWEISDQDKQLFLEAVESLEHDDVTQKKFDLIEDKSFKIRKRKSSFREPGEQIKANMDLHGLKRDEAVTCLDNFCHQSACRGIRTLMVITGKGIHSQDQKITLKEEVIRWLNSEKGRRLVEFYRPGSRNEGGDGAIILYLYRTST